MGSSDPKLGQQPGKLLLPEIEKESYAYSLKSSGLWLPKTMPKPTSFYADLLNSVIVDPTMKPGTALLGYFKPADQPSEPITMETVMAAYDKINSQTFDQNMADLNTDKWVWCEETQSFKSTHPGFKDPDKTKYSYSTSYDYDPVDVQLSELFPAVVNSQAKCPHVECLNTVPMSISYTIQHLNDNHRWTREQIADWLETLDIDLTMQPTSRGD